MGKIKMSKSNLKTYFLLHFILFLYSINGIFSKLTSTKEFISLDFILLYGVILFNLFIYAILWQQILKKIPLSIAFSNKSVVIIWGMIWGKLIFNETIKWNMILGTIIIILGVYMVVKNNENG